MNVIMNTALHAAMFILKDEVTKSRISLAVNNKAWAVVLETPQTVTDQVLNYSKRVAKNPDRAMNIFWWVVASNTTISQNVLAAYIAAVTAAPDGTTVDLPELLSQTISDADITGIINTIWPVLAASSTAPS